MQKNISTKQEAEPIPDAEKEKVPENLKSKAFIAKVDENNHFLYMGGSWRNNMLSAKIPEFGDFCIVVDTINPIIKGVNISFICC